MHSRFAGARARRALLCICLFAAATLAGCGGEGGAAEPSADSTAEPAEPDREPQQDSVTLNWQPPTENTDGTALTDLAGYRVYSGTHRDQLELRETLENPGLSSYVVTPLAPGEQYFAISSVNSNGIEGARSVVIRASPG